MSTSRQPWALVAWAILGLVALTPSVGCSDEGGAGAARDVADDGVSDRLGDADAVPGGDASDASPDVPDGDTALDVPDGDARPDVPDGDARPDVPDGDAALDVPDASADVDLDALLDPDEGPPLPLALFDEPLSTDAPPLATRSHPLAPSSFWADATAPLPTNSWWMNLVLGTGQSPVNAFPYLVWTPPGQLVVSAPGTHASDQAYVSQRFAAFRVTASESLGAHTVVGYDDLSVTLLWTATEGAMTVPLVRGSPYVTASYDALTPRLTSQFAMDLGDSPNPGTRFEVSLDNGTVWLVYASSEVAWTVGPSTLTATAPYTGTLRIALVGGGANAEALLDAHAGAVVTGGRVGATSLGDSATLTFEWAVEGSDPPLMMALPHHLATLTTATDDGLTYATLRGPLTAVSGRTWTFEEPLTTIRWSAPSGLDPSRRADVEAALEADADLAPVAADPYFFGKQVAAMGRLALIADELGRDDLAASIRAHLADALAPWATASRTDPPVYDETWGGVVVDSALGDPGRFFGQGYYNDHHFHYGYHIYAAAALARGDRDWAEANADYVLALVRDIANPSPDDPYFTVFRSKDWYTGHSWAAGLFEFADSRNQESTSEAVNAYYAVALWGLTTDDRRLYDLGRLALATEVRAAQVYWQIRQDDAIYPSPFRERGVVGIVWDLKAVYATFFGANDEYIYGIQMLPFTPISEALLDPDWVAEVYPFIESDILGRAAPPLEESWRGLMLMSHAVIDPDAAWDEVQTLSGYDDGNTATNTLYWVATRP